MEKHKNLKFENEQFEIELLKFESLKIYVSFQQVRVCKSESLKIDMLTFPKLKIENVKHDNGTLEVRKHGKWTIGNLNFSNFKS